MRSKDALRDIKSICNLVSREVQSYEILDYQYISTEYEYSDTVYNDINKGLRPLKIKLLNSELSREAYDKEKKVIEKRIKRMSDKDRFTLKTYTSRFHEYNFINYEMTYGFIINKIINSNIHKTDPIDIHKYDHLFSTRQKTLESNLKNILTNINYYNNMYVYRNNPGLNTSVPSTLIFGKELYDLYIHTQESNYKIRNNTIFEPDLDRKSIIVTIPNNQISEGINVIIDEENKRFLYSETTNFDYNYYEIPII